MAKRVKDIMTPINSLVYLSPADTVETAYQEMKSKKIHSVLVKSYDDVLPRIFEEEDLRYVWSQKVDTKVEKLGDWAKSIDHRADPEWPCDELRSHFRYTAHLIVADEYGRMLGLVSTNDLRKC